MTWKFHGLTIVSPKLTDPRLFMICILTLYTLVGQFFLSFDHLWLQIGISIFVACTLDMLINYRKSRQLVLPASGLITGMSLGLLVEAVPLWPFVVAPLLAVGSKAFLQVNGRHIFNPSNFGLTVLVLLFPATVTTLAAQWTGSLLISVVILSVGGFTSFRVSRWDLVLSFVVGFCIMALVEQMLQHNGFAFVFGPLLGAAFQLFILSMITDPKTSPETRPMRIVFGLSLAVVDGVLRLMQNQYSPFIALLIVASVVPVVRSLEPIVKNMLSSDEETGEAKVSLASQYSVPTTVNDTSPRVDKKEVNVHDHAI